MPSEPTDLESRDRTKFEVALKAITGRKTVALNEYDVNMAWESWQAARAGNEELRECLQGCYVLLESLRVSVKWELAPEVKKAIAELVTRAEALLERGKG